MHPQGYWSSSKVCFGKKVCDVFKEISRNFGELRETPSFVPMPHRHGKNRVRRCRRFMSTRACRSHHFSCNPQLETPGSSSHTPRVRFGDFLSIHLNVFMAYVAIGKTVLIQTKMSLIESLGAQYFIPVKSIWNLLSEIKDEHLDCITNIWLHTSRALTLDTFQKATGNLHINNSEFSVRRGGTPFIKHPNFIFTKKSPISDLRLFKASPSVSLDTNHQVSGYTFKECEESPHQDVALSEIVDEAPVSGCYVDFHFSPNFDLPESSVLSRDILGSVSSNFKSMQRDLSQLEKDLNCLSELGELPIECLETQGVIRVHFPNCDKQKVELLLQEKGIQSGIITESSSSFEPITYGFTALSYADLADRVPSSSLASDSDFTVEDDEVLTQGTSETSLLSNVVLLDTHLPFNNSIYINENYELGF